MKTGDLVRCTFQPRCGGYDRVAKRLLPCPHNLKGEFGIILEKIQERGSSPRYQIMFPQFGYTHILSQNVLEHEGGRDA